MTLAGLIIVLPQRVSRIHALLLVGELDPEEYDIIRATDVVLSP